MNFLVAVQTMLEREITRAHFHPEKERSLKILLLYEDFEAGRRAMDVRRTLTRQFQSGFEFCDDMWKFDALQVGKLAEIAADDARQADIIIVASANGEPPPRKLLGWMERSLSARGNRGGALVALQSGPSGDARACEPLESMAQRSHLEFFLANSETPRGSSSEFINEMLTGSFDQPAAATVPKPPPGPLPPQLTATNSRRRRYAPKTAAAR